MKIKIIILVLSGVLLTKLRSFLYKPAELPELDGKFYWGPGDARDDDPKIYAFKVNISEKRLKDLEWKLDNSVNLVPPLENINHEYGLNTKFLRKFVDYWRTQYDWRKRERYINQYPHYKTVVQGLEIHFVRVKPQNLTKGIKIIPLLVLHGWPETFLDSYQMIPLLTTPRNNSDFVFELVIPSLPGFGFSQSAAKPGLDVRQTAMIFLNLMKRLGFDEFYVQGRDWGALVVMNSAILFPKNIKGGLVWPRLLLNQRGEYYQFFNLLLFILRESGYLHFQSTKPDTIGVALTDSPIGWAAYFLEKMAIGTNGNTMHLEDHGLTLKYSYDKLLDNVMIYWLTQSITTSFRLYKESFTEELFPENLNVYVPTACVHFKNDFIYFPEWILRDRFRNLVQMTEFDFGGHFAALEVPDVLAEDIWQAVKKMRSV